MLNLKVQMFIISASDRLRRMQARLEAQLEQIGHLSGNIEADGSRLSGLQTKFA